MPTSAAIMKLEMCIMTSLLWVLGQCSDGVTLNCSHPVVGDILNVTCTVVFTIGKTEDKDKETCEVEKAILNNDNNNNNDTNADRSGNNTFTVEVKAEKGRWRFTVQTGCGPAHHDFDVTYDGEQHDKNIDGKSPPPTDDPPVQTGVAWAIGGVIAVLTLAIVLLAFKGLRRHSSLWTRAPSADMDVESNEEGSSRQDSHSEPLSGGQELRDTHTPPMTSHTDDSSS
ncbi:uncharacterized protein LOC134077023 [Sardina pilchardus]|uniref:uncharacterized protein LOC134077023 n=1 Tax=Sardina pilchardus TaxID=27697 RepID=UPI002E10A5CD